MPTIVKWILLIAGLVALSQALNVLSYRFLKKRIVGRRKWDLNICCGKTDGGGVNADIARHAEVPRFVRIASVDRLPFKDGAFGSVLCSHTMEHVEDPEAFYRELVRVGGQITLPRRVRLPLSRTVQRRLGQRIHA
jgi:SAM-dependent methyltransferase